MTLHLAAVLNGTEGRALEPSDTALRTARLDVADLARPISGVVIDSRLVEPASIFVALPGAAADGHNHLVEAWSKGASAALVSRTEVDVPLQRNQLVIRVPDTLTALQGLAAYWRAQHRLAVVAVTGSVGKTTAKEVIASLLQQSFLTLRNQGNLNTEIGLPLTLLNLRSEHRAAVLEMGMYAAGDIALLAEIARPEVGVVTNVAPVHLERMGSIERIAAAKAELVNHLPAHGLAVLNADDPWTLAMGRAARVEACLIGFDEAADFRATNVELDGLTGVRFDLRAEGRLMSIRAPIPGRHTVYAILAAAAVARRLGLGWDHIVDGLRRVQTVGRQQITRSGAMTIIDDSYNAAPMSVTAALELLGMASGRRIAVLGDMLELGAEEEQAHRQVGARAAKVADWLVVRGDRSNWIADAALDGGLKSERIRRVASNEQAIEQVRDIASAGTSCSVLVKGSLGMHMKEVVDGLAGPA
ncbi:MAG: UDP-N-acetylmuramoyl-tripeptide--D-alanyl-D-alanine ligase [Chloroflexota bacterium]